MKGANVTEDKRTEKLKDAVRDIRYHEWRWLIFTAPIITLVLGVLLAFFFLPREIPKPPNVVGGFAQPNSTGGFQQPTTGYIAPPTAGTISPPTGAGRITSCPPGQHATFTADGTIVSCFIPDPNRR